MSDRTDGGPAFPSGEYEEHDGGVVFQLTGGMTLRDWFAGMAMQAAIANPNIHVVDASDIPEPQVAEIAYEMADAMLRHRSGEDQKPQVET